MGKVTGLAHIGIMVKDLEVSRKFYVEKLGFEEECRNDLGGTVICFLNNGTCLLELVCRENYQAPTDPRAHIDHVCMEVEGIDSLVASLKEQGVEFESDVNYSSVNHGGVKNIFFHGPDGERIEFFEYQR